MASEDFHILVADDEPSIRKSLEAIFNRAGYQCDCVSDGDEALEALDRNKYHLLISDIVMPGNDDMRLIEKVAQSGDGPPVILLTGYPSVGTAIQSIELPVVAYMCKPVDINELLAHVEKLRKNQESRQAVHRVIERLQSWREELGELESCLDYTRDQRGVITTEDFLDISFRNLLAALTDVRNLTTALASDASHPDVCQVLNCPRLNRFRKAVKKTIDTLEATKSAFKSRQLGQLREELEALLDAEKDS